jgi:DNA-directed RNA polymerase subunit RPC12/RpoP
MAQNQYKCEACGATFNSEEALERHNRMLHSQHKCLFCGEAFTSETELEAHNRTMHPEREETRTQ